MNKELDVVLKSAFSYISDIWDRDIIPELMEYIKIPNKSPMFDLDWESNGYMDKAMQLIVDWCERQPLSMQLKVVRDKGKTPLLFIDISGQLDETILLYGHMDKQPEMTGWDKDLGPWKPVIKDGKLYGRGGADDGYAVYSAITAIATLEKNNIPHARCVLIIEGSEESGSSDLLHYINQLKAEIGEPNLIICLDTSALNYEQLWSTTSLRGLVGGNLRIEMLSEGVHSGLSGGVVPSAFMILRQLMERLEDKKTGEFLLKEFNPPIPEKIIKEAKLIKEMVGDKYYTAFPFVEKTQPLTMDIVELVLNKSWRPALSVVGMDGFPDIANAGNVTLPKLTIKLSVRTPPNCDTQKTAEALKKVLEKEPPFNAKIHFDITEFADGWVAPETAPWLEEINEHASQLFFNKPAAYVGEGGSIPFMGMLGKLFPKAQFLITGVLGPQSNAHGPNEFLHIDMGKKITGCISAVIAYHYRASK